MTERPKIRYQFLCSIISSLFAEPFDPYAQPTPEEILQALRELGLLREDMIRDLPPLDGDAE